MERKQIGTSTLKTLYLDSPRRFTGPFLVAAAFLLAGQALAGNAPAASGENYRAYVDWASCNKPVWPKASLRNSETGTVTLAFLVSAEGALIDSKIVRSSGFRDLDNAAHIALRQCTFHAAIENGKPVESWMKMQYVWSIENTPRHQGHDLSGGVY